MQPDPGILHRAAVIRPGADADGPGYRALIAACWGEYTPDFVDVDAEIPDVGRLATALAGQGGALWTAQHAGQVVGMVGTYPAEDGWHVSRMYVASGQRGTGLAGDLLRTAEDHARAAGGTRMVLWSDVLFARAHAFYEKHGYLRRGGLRALGNPAGSIEAGFAKPLAGRVVEACDVAAAESAERPLAALLQACVDGGAAASFLAPLSAEKARAYWRGVTGRVGRGEVRLFAAWRDGVLGGAVQLVPDTADDGRHRGMKASFLHWSGKDKDGPTSVTLGIFGVSDNLVALLTVWSSPAGDKLYGKTLDGVVASIKRAQ